MQSNLTQPKNKTQKIIIITLILIIIFLLWQLIACRRTQPAPTAQAPAGQPADTASILHGTMTFISQIGDDLDIEFWFDHPKYRLTWSKQNQEPYLHMISPDGQKLYHHQLEEDTTNLSYISPNMHLWMFTEPTDYKNLATWTEDDLEVKQYLIQQLWSIEGAVQDFYLEDITKYFSDDQLQKVVLRTTSSKPESAADLVESTYHIDSLESLAEVDQELFTVPK